MTKLAIQLSILAAVGLAVVVIPACAPMDGGGDGMNGDGNGMNGDGNGMDGNGDGMDGDGMDGDGMGGGGTGLTAIKTDIDVHNSGRISVGDDILVYGFGGFAGVDYVVPSANDTSGRGIPNGDTFRNNAFAAMGKKIALTSNFLVTIFDTESETSVEIPEEDVRLTNSPVGLYDQGHIKADGNLLAVRNDNGSAVTVIDVSGTMPDIITFANDIDGNVAEVAIDATTMQVVAVTGDNFVVYDISDPDATPVEWDVSGAGGIGDSQLFVSDGYIFYEDGEAFGNARFLEISSGMITTLDENPQANRLAADGGRFCYFVNRDAGDSNGNDARSGIGMIPGPGATLAGDTMIDGSTTNNGFIGWSQQCEVTPDGTLTFLSGETTIGSGEFLQVSNGGSFSLVNDPDGSSPFGLPATDVDANNALVGFKTGDGTTAGPDTKVGYIILN